METLEPIKSGNDIEDQLSRNLIKILGILSVIFSILTPIGLQYIQDPYPQYLFHGTIFVIGVVLIILSKKSKSIQFVTYLTLLFGICTITFIHFKIPDLIISRNITLVIFLPTLAFFLLGTKKGFIFSFLYSCFIIILSWYYVSLTIIKPEIIFNIVLGFLVVISITFAYAVKEEKLRLLVKERDLLLEKNIDELRLEIQKRELTEKNLLLKVEEIQEQQKQLEKMNVFMIGRELRIIELKKRIKDLEEKTAIS
jgi:hypothetical protein